MKQYVASVTLNGELKIVKMKYSSMKEFARDLRLNGYRVRFIATEGTFDSKCEKYHEQLEKARLVRRLNAKSNERIVALGYHRKD